VGPSSGRVDLCSKERKHHLIVRRWSYSHASHSPLFRLGSLAKFAAKSFAVASMQKRQAHTDEADDDGSDSGEEGPADIVVCFLLPEPPLFSFVT
jgi:hypothetical protein